MTNATLTEGLTRIERARVRTEVFRRHWAGEAPSGYLSPKSVDALDNRLARLGVNFPRLVVSAHADRLALAAINYQGELSPVWDTFLRANGVGLAELIHSDRLLFGASFVTVWADDDGEPTITGDTPQTMAVIRDPATGQVASAVRRVDGDGRARAVLYQPTEVSVWESSADTPAAGPWKRIATLDNPLDVVPVVPFVRRLSLSDPADTGASIVTDVSGLSDAINKLLQDAMVTSEYHARPRRWATGLEIEEDDDGNPIDPFGESRMLQSESPDTKFGQLDAVRLDGYSDLIATLTQQIGSLTGLPPHYLGLHGDQPANAEGVKAAETQLVVAAYEAQRQVADPWRTVAWLLDAVEREATPVRADRRNWSVDFESPEIRTPAQQADAAMKHRTIGVPLEYVVRHLLDYPADQLDALVSAARADAILSGLNRDGVTL